MPKALIFDFDGVLVLSEEARFRALQRIAAKYGAFITPDHFFELVGTTTKNFLLSYFPDLSEQQRASIQTDFNREFKEKIIDHITPIIETTEFVRDYNGQLPLSVASGSDVKVLTVVLEHLGLYDKFQHVHGKEHVTDHKPHPAIYQLTAQELGLEPKDCVVIEDSVSGATAAIAAGCPVYIFLNSVNDESLFKDMPVSGFVRTREDISALLR